MEKSELTKLNFRRLMIVSPCLIICFIFIAARLIDIQLVRREPILEYVHKSRNSVISKPAIRGEISDVNGVVLAVDRPVVELSIDPWFLVESIEAAEIYNGSRFSDLLREVEKEKRRRFAGLLDLPYDAVEDLFKPEYRIIDSSDHGERLKLDKIKVRWRSLHQGVADSVFSNVEENMPFFFNYGDEVSRIEGLPKGLIVNYKYQRAYPNRSIAAHILGFINKEGQPIGGVEQRFDLFLRGHDGWIETERDGLRREMPQHRKKEVNNNDGHEVVLYLDLPIQVFIENEMHDVAGKYYPSWMAVIVSEVSTGAIKAMANYPTFDLNQYSQSPLDVHRNRAISDIFDPGSTVKPLLVAWAIDQKILNEKQIFDLTKTHVQIEGRSVPLIPDDHVGSYASVPEILEYSSNIGAGQIAALIGKVKIDEMLAQFGFGQRTQIPVYGEGSGLLIPRGNLTPLDIVRIGSGYSMSVTAIQLHRSMGVIAGDGTLLKPLLVYSISNGDGSLVVYEKKKAIRSVISDDTARKVRYMLAHARDKLGEPLPDPAIGVTFGGKTGTAQKLIEGRYSEKVHVGSYVGFFPVQNPKYLVTVVVDSAVIPGGENYGSAVAFPMFKKIAKHIARLRNIND